MKIVTIEEIKKHTRIDGNAEDDVLQLYGESAEAVTLATVGATYEELLVEYGEIPVPIKHAVLMLTAHSYNNREPASGQKMWSVPYTWDVLLKPYLRF